MRHVLLSVSSGYVTNMFTEWCVCISQRWSSHVLLTQVNNNLRHVDHRQICLHSLVSLWISS